MRRALRQILILASLLVIVAFAVFLVNQTAEFVGLAERIHPLLGQGVLWGLLFVYAFCVLVPVYLLVRLPKPLVPPDSENGPEFDEHLRRLARRLEANPLLRGRTLATRGDIEAALEVLNARADEITKSSASQVFVTTAISQNGSLDAVLVLAAQSRLVLNVARVYVQRPTARDLLYLYANVASTAFISSELEDVDLSQQIQPALTSVLGSAAGAVPGLGAASALIVNSVTTGTANAFLTLRVGILAKQYSGALVRPARRSARRSATLQATQMLGAISVEGAAKVSRAVLTASKRTVGSAVHGVGSYVKETGSAVIGKLTPRKPRPAGPDAPAVDE